MKQENLKIFATGGVFLLVVTFFVYRDYQREEKLRLVMAQQSLAGGQKDRAAKDPYLQNEVKNTIIKGYKDLQGCYKDFLATNPEVTDGDIKMDWQIETDGDVDSPAVVTSPFREEKFHKCMADKITAWRFPEPPVKKYVSHTFKFSRQDEKK